MIDKSIYLIGLKALGLFFFVLLFTPVRAYAAFDVAGILNGANPAHNTMMLEDKDKKLTIDDLRNGEWSAQFKKLDNDNTFFGISSSAYWFRINLTNSSGRVVRVVLETAHVQFDEADLYYYPKGGTPAIFKLGKNVPIKNYPLGGFGPAFPIVLKPAEEGTLYLSLSYNNTGLMLAQLNIWSPRQFNENDKKMILFSSFITGGAILILFYNIFISFSLRESEYAWYVMLIFVITLNFWSISGFGYRYIWHNSKFMGSAMPVTAGVLGFAFALRFSMLFLDTRRLLPKVDIAMRYMIAACLISILLVLAGFRSVGVISMFVTGVLYSMLPVVGILAWYKGKKEARFYIVAFSALSIGAFIALSRHTGVFGTNFVSIAPASIFFLSSAIFLSLALSDRINILRKKTEETGRELLEHEYALRKVLAESKEELECKVIQRTQELEKAKAVAEDATRLKDQFISLVSHDLRSPLSGIMGTLGVLSNWKDNKISGEQLHRGLEMVHQSSKNLYEFIEELLDVSRLQTGDILPRMELIETRICAEALITRFAPLIDHKKIVIENLIPKAHKIFADIELITEVISNLISNAVKFCRKGDSITLLIPNGAFGSLAVKDSGWGIDASLLPNLFKHEIKTTLLGSAGEAGTGLGLPHSANIMRIHGGTLTVDSVKGEGATFTIKLPHPQKIVLVVDDQQAHREIMKESIKKISGIGVAEAHNGKEALLILEKYLPDLIVTDLSMPDMDGFELIEEVCSSQRFKGIPVIATSNLDWLEEGIHDTTWRAVKDIGAVAFIPKPIDKNKFEKLIRLYAG